MSFQTPILRLRIDLLISFWYRWVNLEPVDVSLGTVIRATTPNPLLAEAWNLAITSLGDDKDIGFWKDKLAAKEMAQLSGGDLHDRNPVETRKRKGTPIFKLPPGYAMEDAVDDDELVVTFLQPGENAGPKTKSEFIGSSNTGTMEELYKDNDSPDSQRTDERNKRSRLDSVGRFATSQLTLRKKEGAIKDETLATSSSD